MDVKCERVEGVACFSALQRAEIAEIYRRARVRRRDNRVSVLFNEPKLLKSVKRVGRAVVDVRFSALQRAEIAEIGCLAARRTLGDRQVSVLFNEPKLLKCVRTFEMTPPAQRVSVLFNEPKLLK